MNTHDGHDEILKHLDTYGVFDKDQGGLKKNHQVHKRKSKKSPYGKTIDLHGMTSEIAKRVLRTALHRCSENGVSPILVIHGQGTHSLTDAGPVLKNMVRSYCAGEGSHIVRDYKAAPYKDGGDGATILYV